MRPSPLHLPPPPRRVRMRVTAGCGLWFIRLFILPHTIVGLVMLGGLFYLPAVWLFGTDAPARVTGLTTGTGKGRKVYYHVRYSYTVNGTDHDAQTSVSQSAYEALTVGQPFSVRVLPPFPKLVPLVRIPGGSSLGGYAFIPFVALFWNGILSLFLWAVYVEPWRMRRLLKYGHEAPGEVLAKEVRRGNKGGQRYFIRYCFRAPAVDESGAFNPTLVAYEGESQVPPAEHARLHEGDPVAVLYYPRKPRRNTLPETEMFVILGTAG